MGMWTPKQQIWMDNANKRYNIAVGARRSGKTYPSYFYIPKVFLDVKDLPGLKVILGTTKGTLQRNLIEPLQGIWTTDVVSNINSENISTMFGMKVHCLGSDNIKRVDQIRGSSIARIAWDEIVTGNKSVWEMVKTSLDKPYSRLYGTGNPDSPVHHIYEFINDPVNQDDIFYQQYTLYDNPKLDPSVIRAFENAYPIGSMWHSRLVLGEWVRAEGVIYSTFNTSNISDGGHIFTDEQAPKYGEWVISVDHGISNPFAGLLWLVVGDVAWLMNEYYHDGKKEGQLTDSEHANNLTKLVTDNVKHYNSGIKCYIDPAAASFKEEIKRQGFFQPVNANNSVMDGIRLTFSAFSLKKLLIHQNCKQTIKGLQSYMWDDNSLDERPLKENDHIADSCRYLVASHLNSKSGISTGSLAW